MSEAAERSRRGDRTAATRAQRIDETLTRLTAAHAGLVVPGREYDDDEDLPAPRRRLRLPRPTAGGVLTLVLALLVFTTTAVGWVAKGRLESTVRDVAALDPGSGAIVDASLQQGDENVLVVATGDAAAPGAPPGTGAGGTVVVLHVPAGGGPVVALSVPTDLEINRPPCEQFDPLSGTYTDQTVRAEARTQLATALEEGGPRCATRVVQQLTGLAVTAFVGVDLDRLGAAVDAVGGVEVCVTRPVLDGVLGPVVPDPGRRTLDGMRAGDFVRAGDVENDPPSGHGRIERQQQVLAGVLDAALSSTGLLDVGQLAALHTTLGDALVVDGVGLGQTLAVATTLRSLDADGVTFAAVPTAAEANGRGNTELRDADAATLFSALRADTPLPEGATDVLAGGTGPTPADVSVEVLNASGTSGLAAEVGDTLRSLGFGIGDVENADQPTSQTVIRFSPDRAAAAGLLAGTVPSATSVPDPGTSGVLQLVLGRSFDDVVRAPAEPDTAEDPAVAADAGPAAAACG